MEHILRDLRNKKIHYGEYVEKVRDLFSRKQESITKYDDRFFSKYWQVYSWCAIIGFREEKRILGADLPNQTSFEYQMIDNGSQFIAQSLLFMALGKIPSDASKDLLNPRKLLTVISEYAEGGAKHILEIRQTRGSERMFDNPDDYFEELLRRIKS